MKREYEMNSLIVKVVYSIILQDTTCRAKDLDDVAETSCDDGWRFPGQNERF